MSWRLWNRETFCCEAQPHLATTPAIDVPLPRPSPKDVPELSASVDSITSEPDHVVKESSSSSPRNIKRQSEEVEDSALSRSRGREKHITRLGLEKMIINIKEKTEIEPLPPSIQASLPAISDTTPRPSSPSRQTNTQTSPSESQLQHSSDSCFSNITADSQQTDALSDHRGSDSSVSSGGLIKSGSVVHGFSPSQMSSSYRSRSKLSHDVAVPARPALPSKADGPKKGGMFTLGGSSGDDESSFEDRMSFRPKKSSLSEGLSKPMEKHRGPTFKEVVQSKIVERDDEDEGAIETDEEEEEEEISDSAIEDSAIEDEGEWEDSESENGKSSVEDKTLFQRVDSRPNLVSRRSMLTMQLHEPQRVSTLASAASKSSPAFRRSRTSSPTGPSLPASPDEDESVLTMRGPGSSRPKPIITTTSNTHPPAHSPRTTRRNMLATELTESLRKHLLWERQQKSTTANAVFKRRHTAQNMAHLQEYPGVKPGQAVMDASKNNSWNHYFDAPWEYHTKGW